ncbi:hypothetical protein LX32DRAFT_641363 [Colletotrichum zoysiae]|uniref:Uncharacterized protein n=1 Tax=Colletotrichum zoysiae TaxID=1216348 RepID=A0AAD9LZP8_9PEZI|nr:hypothetical protein LX32DRAFT_641363 [Colletotrichum zoysiae]
MSVTSNKNAQRKEWRDRCREKLHEHILDRTQNEDIKLLDVRLITKETDPYRWKFLYPEIEKLFKCNLSDCSIGPLKKLWEEVGKSFEAVRVDALGDREPAGSQSDCDLVNRFPASFSEKVEMLARENDELKNSLREANERLNGELRLKQQSEARAALLEEEIGRLRERIKHQLTEFVYLREYVREFADGIEKFTAGAGGEDMQGV